MTDRRGEVLKWTAFAKPNLVLPLAPPLPISASKPKGFACCFDKVEGWNPPAKLLEENGFFGSTWMGVPIELHDDLPDNINFNYNDIAYAMSRVSDPSCIGVVEIVVSQRSKNSKLLVSQYGCGWTVINVFSLLFGTGGAKNKQTNGLSDIEYGHESAENMVISLYRGSPRQLLSFHKHRDMASFYKDLVIYHECNLYVRLYAMRKLELLREHIKENEVIGRYDIIPGLKSRSVVLPDDTQPSDCCCIGDDEVVVQNELGTVSQLIKIPNSIQLTPKMTLSVKNFQISIPNLNVIESKLKQHLGRLYSLAPSDVNIHSRQVQIGLHNGHTVINGDMLTIPMHVLKQEEERHVHQVHAIADSKSVNATNRTTLVITNRKLSENMVFDQFCAHEYMALVFLLQYDIHTPKKTHPEPSNSKEVEFTTTTVTMGAGIYFPYMGNRITVKQHNIGLDEEASKDIQIFLNTNETLCSLLTTNPIFEIPKSEGGHSLGRHKDTKSHAQHQDAKTVRFNEKKESKASEGVDGHENTSADGGLLDEDYLQKTALICNFDVELTDCHDQVLHHGDKVVNGKKDKQHSRDGDMIKNNTEHSDSDSDEKSNREKRSDSDSVTNIDVRHSRSRGGDDHVITKGRRSVDFEHEDMELDADYSSSMVIGNAEASGIHLDPSFYDQPDNNDNFTSYAMDMDLDRGLTNSKGHSIRERRAFEETNSHLIVQNTDQHSLLRQSLNSKLSNHLDSNYKHSLHMDRDKQRVDGSEIATISRVEKHRLPSSTTRVLNASNTIPLSAYVRELPRSTRSALTRYGYGTVLQGAKGLQPIQGVSVPHSQNPPTSLAPLNIGLEMEDPLKCHEIQIQFAGYCSGGAYSSLGSYPMPKNIYCSFQFYTCRPIRTEVMKLNNISSNTDGTSVQVNVNRNANAQQGNTLHKGDTMQYVHTNSVLTRVDSDIVYDGSSEIPLCIKFDIDTSPGISSPTEAFEFIDYLSHNSLFIDVWDADASLLLGTCFVPLKHLLRQGSGMCKSAVECDIVNSDIRMFHPGHGSGTTSGVGSMTSAGPSCSIISHNRGPVQGSVVGALQMIVSNIGHKGAGNTNNKMIGYGHGNTNDMGLNWRAMGGGLNHPHDANPAQTGRPRNIVRARPLSDSSPELNKILNDYRANSTASMRSITAKRDVNTATNGLYTLTYDELSILFRRYQGKQKGTINYSSDLITLLDVPSWSIILKKLVTLYNRSIDMGYDMAEGLAPYGDSKGFINKTGIREYMKMFFERLGIPIKSEELSILSHQLVALTTIEDDVAYNKHVSNFAKEVTHSQEDSKKVPVTSTTNTTVKNLLNFCASEANRIQWKSIGKKFRRFVTKNNMLSTNNGGIDLQHILAEIDNDGDDLITADEFHDVLRTKFATLSSTDATDGTSKKNSSHVLSNEDMKLIIYQFKYIPRGDNTNIYKISLRELFAFLGINYVGNLTTRLRSVLLQVVNSNSDVRQFHEHATDVLTRYGNKHGDNDDGVAVWDVTYSIKEIEQILREFNVYEHLTHEQVGVVCMDVLNLKKRQQTEPKEDANSDLRVGISFNELCSYLNIGIEADMDATRAKEKADAEHDLLITKLILKFQNLCNKAVETAGITLDQIFSLLDRDKDGTISSVEFSNGLKKYPQFQDVSDEDFLEIFQILDEDKSGLVSLKEFEHLITSGKYTSKRKKSSSLHTNSKNFEMNGGDRVGTGVGTLFAPHPKCQPFVICLKRIAVNEGGIVGLLSYLDRDEDGLIGLNDFLRYLKRENVIMDSKRDADTSMHQDSMFTENEIQSILKPILLNNKSADSYNDINIIATGLLYLLENDCFDQELNGSNYQSHTRVLKNKNSKTRRLNNESKSEGKDNDSDEELSDGEENGTLNLKHIQKQYTFSDIPEVYEIEKKMRQIGRLSSQKGVNIEHMFQKYDIYHTGVVRTTEFMEILTSLGLYILERGKVLDSVLNNQSKSDTEMLQKSQISGLRHNYHNNATHSAQKLISAEERLKGHRGGRSDFREHLESIALVNMYRQGQKKQMLQRVLSHSLSNTIQLYPRFGKTLFFEYPITNPFSHEESFLIDITDSELRLVTDLQEWYHLRAHCRPCVGEINPQDPSENEIFDADRGNNKIQVLLLPHETFYLPFTYMTLIPYTGKLKHNTYYKHEGERRTYGRDGRDWSGYDEKTAEGRENESEPVDKELSSRSVTIKVISGSHGHVINVLNVDIYPRPCVINRVLRYYEPGNTLLKRQIQLLGHEDVAYVGGDYYSNGPGAGSGATNRAGYNSSKHANTKYVHCVETNGNNRVVIEWNCHPCDEDGYSSTNCNSILSIMLRYRCGSYPAIGSFYILIYNDPYQSNLYEIWEVVVQSCQKVDVVACVGNVSTIDLVVRGNEVVSTIKTHPTDSHANPLALAMSSRVGNRRCKAFYLPTPFDKIQFHPHSAFQLVANAYNKLTAQYTCTALGARRSQVNIVDVDTHELISSWLLCITTNPPVVARSYDVDFEINGNAVLHKKIIFKNPWDISRKFVLVSSNERVMKSRVNVMEVASLGTSYLRLAFYPPSTSELNDMSNDEDHTVDCYLFLNNEQGESEESFLFHLNYIK